jgi:hypothetical protein
LPAKGLPCRGPIVPTAQVERIVANPRPPPTASSARTQRRLGRAFFQSARSELGVVAAHLGRLRQLGGDKFLGAGHSSHGLYHDHEHHKPVNHQQENHEDGNHKERQGHAAERPAGKPTNGRCDF